MKVLMINGSSHKEGSTFTALSAAAAALAKEGIESEIIQCGKGAIRDCVACGGCRKHPGKCAFDDDIVNEVIAKAKEADGFIFGTPVYYAHPTGRILSLLDRAFYAGGANFAYKPGAAVASARRAGTTASFDVLNKYFTICNMPVVSSSYWNNIHGNSADEAKEDAEALYTMDLLGKNMAWLLKAIASAKESGLVHPTPPPKPFTNFIR